MYDIDAPALAALRTSHAVTYRVTAYTPEGGVLEDVPISGGSVTYDAGSQVRRTADLTVSDPNLWPLHPAAALSPVGSELFVEYGINVPGAATFWVPLIRGPVQKVKRSRPGSSDAVTLSIADRSAKVAEDRFDAPTQTLGGRTCVAEITRLIQETLPGVEVLDLTGSTQVAPVLDIDKERWADGIEKLADAIGAEVYADRVGGFVIAPVPSLANGTASWLVDAGETGVLVTFEEELSREKVYNAVIASGERTDGIPAVYAKVVDDEPGSPTFYGGTFGRRPYFLSSQLLTSQAQCLAAAQARFERVRGLHATVSLTQVPNPGIDPGDLLTVIPDAAAPEAAQLHVADTVQIDLDPTSAQPLGTRTLDALDQEEAT